MEKSFAEIAGPERACLAPLTAGWQAAMVQACLEGCAGRAWAAGTPPRSALLAVGDFCFFAGEAHAPLAAFLPPGPQGRFRLLVPQTAAWERALEKAWPNCERLTRYAFCRDEADFDPALLHRYAAGPAACYRLAPIDEALYGSLLAEPWSRDLCAQFPTWAAYSAHGLGWAALHGGRPVSGASAYAYYSGGIEIEVDTKPTYRRRGLARACAARLILDCLARGLHPGWDAANPASARLARTLGYRPAGAYTAYAVGEP